MERPWDDVAADLKTITAPLLYAGGAHDAMIDADGSYAAVQVLPNAKLVLCSDAGYAFLFQYLDDFVRETLEFLSDGAHPSSGLLVRRSCSANCGASRGVTFLRLDVAKPTLDPDEFARVIVQMAKEQRAG